MTDDVRKLLGGYATGTLSEDERNALYSAALEDEELFAALADEQVLKNLLEDPAARAELLQVASASRPAKRSLWLWWLAPVSMALIVSVVAIRFSVDKPAPVITAEIRTPAVPPPAPVQQAAPEVPRATPVKTARQAEASADKTARKDVAPPAIDRVEPPAASASVSQSVEVGASAVLIEPSPANRMADENRPMKALAVAKKAEEVDSLSLQYTLLKQSATGEFEPVANDAVFSKSDVVRVKVQSAVAGTITVIQGSKVVASESVVAAGDHVLPRQGGIPLSAGTTLELSIQQPPGGITQAFSARGRAASDAVGGTRRIVIRLKTE